MKKITAFLLSVLVAFSMLIAGSSAEVSSMEPSVNVTVIKAFAPNSTIIVGPGDEFEVTAKGSEGEAVFFYAWDKDLPVYEIGTATPTLHFSVPSEFENNSAHLLYVSAGSVDEMANYYYQIIVSDKVTSFITLDAKLEGKDLIPEETVEVVGGEQIEITALTSLTNSSIALIGYYFVENGEKLGETNNVEGGLAAITVPDAAPGTERLLFVEAVDACDDGTENQITKTGWQRYLLKYSK